ncbi:MAG: type II toxin-antitoxin system HicB family antitoxin [Candidatus Paceibacterota bacterium]|jgi:predicted RNase H-like HicB family nuclease
MKKTNLKATIWKEGKYYVSQCLNVDVASFGLTKKEALENLQEALLLYLEDLKIPRITKVERPNVVSFNIQYA